MLSCPPAFFAPSINRAQQQLDRGLQLWNEAGDSEEAYDHALAVIAEAEAKLATAEEK
jgi:F-type H+-transporting ATPase subunit epsilon